MLVFDGDCGFCTSSARWIEARLPDDVAVVAWQACVDEVNPNVTHHVVPGSHMGLGFNATVYRLVAQALAAKHN